MQYLSRSKMLHRDVVTLLHSLLPWGKKYIAVVEDKNSPQSQTWQASMYMVSIPC